MYEFYSKEKLEKLFPILNTEADMIINFVSCDGAMGYKLSGAIAAIHPEIKYKFQNSCANGEFAKGKVTIIKKVYPFIFQLPFKDSFKESPTIEHLREGFEKLEFVHKNQKIIVNKIAIQKGIVPDDMLFESLKGLDLPEIIFYEEYDYYKELAEKTKEREEKEKAIFLKEQAENENRRIKIKEEQDALRNKIKQDKLEEKLKAKVEKDAIKNKTKNN